MKAGNEKPAAAATWSDCNKAAECSWALRRSSATDVVRGSLPVDVVEPVNVDGGDELEDGTADVPLLVADRLWTSEEIVAAADDVIVGQHEHNPGKAEKKITIKNFIEFFMRI